MHRHWANATPLHAPHNAATTRTAALSVTVCGRRSWVSGWRGSGWDVRRYYYSITLCGRGVCLFVRARSGCRLPPIEARTLPHARLHRLTKVCMHADSVCAYGRAQACQQSPCRCGWHTHQARLSYPGQAPGPAPGSYSPRHTLATRGHCHIRTVHRRVKADRDPAARGTEQ